MAKKKVATLDHVERVHIRLGLPWLVVPLGTGIVEFCEGEKAADARSIRGVLRAQYYITAIVGSSACVVFSHRSLPWLIRRCCKESGQRKAIYKTLMS